MIEIQNSLRYLLDFILAEKAGFEPAVQLELYAHFPGVCLKPLGHLSSNKSNNPQN